MNTQANTGYKHVAKKKQSSKRVLPVEIIRISVSVFDTAEHG
ncbi:MAG: hypothetical protein OFPI_28790 [Osedax symbiont Rs2]|nr:MAG: hypothetical protein OFPI_28790 [Osedax symbiont Rs2]